jgi:hypothetical protein
MYANGTTKVPFDPGDILDVIDMAMGEKEESKFDFLRYKPVAGSIGCVEKHPTFRRLQGITIRLKNAASEAPIFDHLLSLFFLLLSWLRFSCHWF